MELHPQRYDQCDLIRIVGEVMATDVASLERTLQRYLDVGRYRILIDLQRCTYIGSSGLSLLITFANSCRRWNRGDLCLVAPHEYVCNLLRIAGLLGEERSFFRIVETVDEGLQYFDRPVHE